MLRIYMVPNRISPNLITKIQSRLITGASFLKSSLGSDNYCQISSKSLFRIQGPDSNKLLQGLITNNMTKIDKGGDALFCAFLSNTGRILYNPLTSGLMHSYTPKTKALILSTRMLLRSIRTWRPMHRSTSRSICCVQNWILALLTVNLILGRRGVLRLLSYGEVTSRSRSHLYLLACLYLAVVLSNSRQILLYRLQGSA